MATPPDCDRRASIAEWAMLNTFELLDDRDQEAERLPLFPIQAVIDRDVHNVCLGLWEDTDVTCFDLRRGSGNERTDSTGAAIAFPYGLPTVLILHGHVPQDRRMVLSIPVVDDHALAGGYEVRSQNEGFTRALLDGSLVDWLLEWRALPPPVSFDLSQDWLLAYAPQLPVDLFPQLLDGLLGFRDRIPTDVLTTFGR
jgi:hypothetical protein